MISPEHIQNIAVIGAGTMGAGIAGIFARAGYAVCLLDRDPALVQKGLATLDQAQQALVEAGRLGQAETEAARRRIATPGDLHAACAGADLVIEAVSEDMKVKQDLFARLDAACSPHALLATNTSGLSIAQIAAATQRPQQVAGLHFWNPPHLVPLVEVTCCAHTAAATGETLMALCKRLGKKPILVRHDIPGFVGNRLQFAVMREALHMLSEGVASAEDIDTAMTAGPGLRYAFQGPLRTADLGGLDVFLSISRYLFGELNADAQAPPMLEALVSKGQLGAKTGAGFYSYSESAQQAWVARRDRALLGFLRVLEQEASGDG